MISVLIPVFDRDVNCLVKTLVAQIKRLNTPVEIVVFDDGSEPYFKNCNRVLANLPFVRYHEHGENTGRIRSRESLALLANYEWLIFLDCDSAILSDEYLQTYSDTLSDVNHVFVGGRLYVPDKPIDCSFRLHWKYGSSREVYHPNVKRHPNRFTTNNFLINKSVFSRFVYNIEWHGYGYEDTWMGIQLEAMGIAVKFIDNAARHDGVESIDAYISKTKNALANLKRLSEITDRRILARHVKLYLYYDRMREMKLLWLVKFAATIFKKSIDKNLHSCEPSLLLFDFFRLNYFRSLLALP